MKKHSCLVRMEDYAALDQTQQITGALGALRPRLGILVNPGRPEPIAVGVGASASTYSQYAMRR